MPGTFRRLHRGLPHVVALALAGGGLCLAAFLVRWQIGMRLQCVTHQIAPLPLHQRNQGLLLQRAAFEAGGVLPVYGSSELTREERYRAGEFFADSPTGFQVCPVGAAGNTCILSLLKIAALGDAVRGRKLVVVLSPSWFMRPMLPEQQFAGNFSPLQAIRTLQSTQLSSALKTRIAARLLDYRDTLEANPDLLLRIRSLVRPTVFTSLLGPFENTMMSIDTCMLEIEDSMLSYYEVLKGGSAARGDTFRLPSGQAPPWEQLLADAEAHGTPPAPEMSHVAAPSPLDVARRAKFASAENGEWRDLAMLLDGLNELHARALVIAIPIGGNHDDAEGILASTRHEVYYDRIERLCRARGVPVRTLEDHDEDERFLVNHMSHPSAIGWVHLDRLLDDFWHDRLDPAWTTTN
ncbi:MAG: D-alanyl-lipoteichoic acid biosynthesis protein DltD [Verrucomicrobiaceae bacterium]|nr:D-alanyl-lipoteichoic acid biosynthesis protein DltD [Verrucomicrobiaceae bacterium]